MKKKLLVYLKTLIGYSVISMPMMLQQLQKYMPYVVSEIYIVDENHLGLKIDFQAFIVAFVLIVEKRGGNNYYVKDIIE